MTMEEADILIGNPNNVPIKKFDVPDLGISQCDMKAVDFIFELNNEIIFLEIKDPDNPDAEASRKAKFVDEIKNGELRKKLAKKCRDSFIYEYSMNNLKNKPVRYIVLLCLNSLGTPELMTQTDLLRKHIPVDGPLNKQWEKKFIDNCQILNIQAWNSEFSEFPISRKSEQAKK